MLLAEAAERAGDKSKDRESCQRLPIGQGYEQYEAFFAPQMFTDSGQPSSAADVDAGWDLPTMRAVGARLFFDNRHKVVRRQRMSIARRRLVEKRSVSGRFWSLFARVNRPMFRRGQQLGRIAVRKLLFSDRRRTSAAPSMGRCKCISFLRGGWNDARKNGRTKPTTKPVIPAPSNAARRAWAKSSEPQECGVAVHPREAAQRRTFFSRLC